MRAFTTSDDGTELTVNGWPMIDATNWQRQFYDRYGTQEAMEFVSSLNHYMNSHHPVYAGKRLNCQQCHRNPPRKSTKIPDHGLYAGKVAMMVEGKWQVGPNYIHRPWRQGNESGQSSNPISYTADRRATHFRVAFWSPVAEDPANCEMICRRLYLEDFTCQTCSATEEGNISVVHRLRLSIDPADDIINIM
jgi:hypothetical protein